jgi:hypothetical protein
MARCDWRHGSADKQNQVKMLTVRKAIQYDDERPQPVSIYPKKALPMCPMMSIAPKKITVKPAKLSSVAMVDDMPGPGGSHHHIRQFGHFSL